jgi:PLP dependent protein
MSKMKENIEDIEHRIQAACDRAGRNRSEVTLIAVSKTKPNEMLMEAYALGMRHFGENKVQELDQKYEDLQKEFTEPVYWHLIGHLQRNKVKYIVDKTVLIHSVDSLRLAMQVEEEAAKKNLICDILIEVNIAEEDTKFGVKEEEVLPLLSELIKLPHLRVRGLMTIAPYVDISEKNRKYFKKLRELYVDIKSKNIDNICNGNILNEASPNPVNFANHFDVLSMGMTGDFEVAIEEGATMVRVGTGIFGERDYSKTV